MFENFATILIETFVHLEGIARAETTKDMKSQRERFFTKEGDFGVQFEKCNALSGLQVKNKKLDLLGF